MTQQKKYRRGYPVAIIVGLKENQAFLWRIYSHVIKPDETVALNGYRSNSKALYNFHESIVGTLRPLVREGVKSILLASPPRTSYAEDFLRHIKEHDAWLTQGLDKASFAFLIGTASTIHEVTLLSRAPEFKRIIGEATTGETENLLDLLEKRLYSASREPLVLYSLEEIEEKVLNPWKPGKPKPEYMLLTDKCLTDMRIKKRLNRLMQIASNKGVKTRVVSTDTSAGKRLIQLGGVVCILSVP